MGDSGRSRRSAAILAFLCAASVRVEPATLVVDDDAAPYTTIQSAIDAAVPGTDDVFVRCGRYLENVTMRDGVSVRGERSGCTFIDPADVEAPVVTMPDLGAGTTLRGFTVENRASSSLDSLGIAVYDGAPTITRNVIRGPGTDGPYSGSGIDVSGGTPVITYNLIHGNHDCCWGGGVTIAWGGGAVVRSNLIVHNAAYYGGGIYAGLGPGGELTHNTIARNEAWIGGGILVAYQGGDVANNVIAFNTAVIYGGGVNDWSSGTGTAFEGNDVFGNAPENWWGHDPTGTDGNISVDPAFVDESIAGSAGYRPRSDSPLVDAAEPVSAPESDLWGLARPVDGDVDGTARADIGAQENPGVTGLVHDGSSFLWDPGLHDPMLYDVYRGDLARLRATAVYTQDPAAVDGAWLFCAVTNGLADPDVPDPGSAFFYPPAARGLVPGTIGFDGGRVERPRTIGCP